MEDESFYVLGIDPGNNLGLCIMELDINLNILSIETRTIILDDYIDKDLDNRLMHRCIYLYNYLDKLIDGYKPLSVAYETAFLNHRFPKSVMQLSQYVNTITTSIKNNNKWIKIFGYPPKYIKKVFGTSGKADKDDMKVSLSKIEELTKLIDIENLTEHSIDSIAIAYTMLLEIRDSPHLLYTLE